jgi:phosphonate transport system ATP-binding protein
MPILEFKNVSKTYDNITKALTDVSFCVEEGEFVSIIGPSGSGKSTILRCINRLVDATQGVIVFDGHHVTPPDRSVIRKRRKAIRANKSLPREERRRALNCADNIYASKKGLRQIRKKIGMIFQHYNLVDRLSVVENVLHGRLGHKSAMSGVIGRYTEQEKENAFQILSKLGLTEQAYKRCDELSGGQKQRVGIARSLMQEPRLILCDEPIASLDPNASKIIMDHLSIINKTMNITCIFNLHQVDVALKYSRRIIGITSGRIVYDGPPNQLSKAKIHEIYQSNEGELITDVG